MLSPNEVQSGIDELVALGEQWEKGNYRERSLQQWIELASVILFRRDLGQLKPQLLARIQRIVVETGLTTDDNYVDAVKRLTGKA